MESKKGISPVIATVLLIAIVLVLASIIFIWMKGFIGEEITKFGDPIKNACNDVDLAVSSDGNALSINNKGSVGVLSIKLKIKDSEDEVLLSCGEINLAPARATTVQLNECDYNNEELISVIPILQGEGEEDEPKTYECSNKEFYF